MAESINSPVHGIMSTDDGPLQSVETLAGYYIQVRNIYQQHGLTQLPAAMKKNLSSPCKVHTFIGRCMIMSGYPDHLGF